MSCVVVVVHICIYRGDVSKAGHPFKVSVAIAFCGWKALALRIVVFVALLNCPRYQK